MGGQGGQLPNLVFADRFYLNKRGQIVPPTSLLAHPNLGSFLRPQNQKILCHPKIEE